MHGQKEIKADQGPERPALGAFHQSLESQQSHVSPLPCTQPRRPLRLAQPRTHEPWVLRAIPCVLPAQSGPAMYGLQDPQFT